MRLINLALLFQMAVQLMPVSGHGWLLGAASAGNARIVNRLIQEGADVNEEGFNRKTALHAAVVGGHFDVVSALVQNGARVDSRAFREACFSGNTEIVSFLIDNGADVNEPDESGLIFPVTYAVRGDKIDVVKLLVQRGARRGFREAVLGSNFLGISVVLFKFLLDNGTDPNFSFGDGTTLLLHAVIHSRLDIARILLDLGADLRSNIAGETPLEWALTRGHLAALDVFVEAGLVRGIEMPAALKFEVKRRLLLGGARNTGSADPVLHALMRPIRRVEAAVAALQHTDPMQAFGGAFPLFPRGISLRDQKLLAFAFESRKIGVDLFNDIQFLENFVHMWSESKLRIVSSIIAELVYLGCTDINFFYTASPFIARENDDMLRHTETALKYLAGSLTGMPQVDQVEKEGYRAINSAILNEMIERSYHIGLRPVAKALFGIYNEEWQIMITLRLAPLPRGPIDIVMNNLHGPFNPNFKAKAMQKLMQSIRKLQQ